MQDAGHCLRCKQGTRYPGSTTSKEVSTQTAPNFDSFVTTIPARVSQAVQTEAIYRSPGQTFTMTHTGDPRWARRASAEPWIQTPEHKPSLNLAGSYSPTPATRTHQIRHTAMQGHSDTRSARTDSDSDPQTPRDARRLRQTDQRTLHTHGNQGRIAPATPDTRREPQTPPGQTVSPPPPHSPAQS